MRDARRKEREEAHLYLHVKVITEDTFRAHSGTDLTHFDGRPDDPASPISYKVLKAMTLQEFASLVAKDIGSEGSEMDPRRIRFWCMVNRQNKTIRPDQPALDSAMSIEDTHLKLAASKTPELRLWTEVAEEVTADGEAIWPSYTTPPPTTNGQVASPIKNDLILLFLKWFDVENQVLKGVGHIYISKEKKVEELVAPILKKMDWPERNEAGEKTQLKLFEVCVHH